ncbi:fimbrial biogenesis outer membrane usher protein [Chromobacterium sp. S0633]|uniref:fimbria/pilus outer membrane usher protein n=1 Tax=Chromobacterium sp. S0633 TaxID=2957805 RepID=UPI0020A17F19|nr:fimbria/pilus outer membrane usher protein [Chromobacterium sp. S0633]MCP1291101.1 fimbrial biogenesis outer membrane usher protein [Chromobacterium sp. S0633]
MRSKPLTPPARRSAATPLACACWLIACAQALAADAPVFNTRFLKLDGQAADLKAVLSAGNDILPGRYRVDILLNRQLADRRDILFRQERDGKVRPCLDAALLRKLGVKLPPSGPGDEACVDLPQRLEHAQARYDSTRLQLELSVPQAHLLRRADGYVDPSLWDAGVNAAYANYQFSGQYRRGQHGRASRQWYLGLQNGLNLGDWRLRNDTTLNGNTGQATEIRSNRTLLQRDITALRSQLALGEQYTDAMLFDSSRIRGAQLSQDEAMLPDSERGYRPVVRGQAWSQATVEVRQNGYVLHRADVPPGPFEFSDIAPSGSNGELEITVTEADGSRRVSHQAFSSLPLMQAQGRWKYHAALGQYQGGEAARPALAAGALVYGLSDDGTVAAGVQLSPRFQAVKLGLGANTPLGALSLDLSQSLSRTQGRRSQGQSLRLLYHKALPRTQTQLTLAAYRYSTAGYRSFNDHAADLAQRANQHRARARMDLSAQQALGREGRRGSLYLSLSRQNDWGRPGASHSLNLAYSHRWKQFHYHLSLSRSRDGRGQGDSQITLGFSLPLDSGRHAPQLSAQLGRDALHTSLSGQLGEADSYTVSVGRDSQGDASLNASGVHQGDVAQLSAAYSAARGHQSASLGASGAIVVHGGGVNLSRAVGDTFALLQVDGAPGLNGNGYSVRADAQPYRANSLSLDSLKLGAGLELEDGVKQVVPRRGAVVKAVFKARSGRRVQFSLRRRDGSAAPFGASVEDDAGQPLGIVDPQGRTLLLLKQPQGLLTVKWSDGGCSARYRLPPAKPGRHYLRLALPCL